MSAIRPLAPIACLLACLLATPGLADLDQDYETLRQAFPNLSLRNDPEIQVRQTAAMIPRLEGRWIPASALMNGELTAPDPDLLTRACERNAYTLAADGNLGLTIDLATGSDPVLVSLRYAGGTTFLASFDEAGMMARLMPGKSFEEMDPQMLYSTLVSNSWLGYLSLMPVGENLILLQPLARPPELLARCPAP